ncbi:hypothetical protein EDB83DRAFT_2327216 [Lactarius deliciosus]|nr:hypothetical protein EDB83DRAFT_2327216 [Lactarius deliciosus]
MADITVSRKKCRRLPGDTPNVQSLGKGGISGSSSCRETNTVERPSKFDKLSQAADPRTQQGRVHNSPPPCSTSDLMRCGDLFHQTVRCPFRRIVPEGPKSGRERATVHVPFPELPGEKMITDTYGIAESHEEGDEMPANLMGTTRDQRMKFHVQFKLIALELLGRRRRQMTPCISNAGLTHGLALERRKYNCQLDRHSLIRKSGGDKQIPEETEAEAMEDCDGLSY